MPHQTSAHQPRLHPKLRRGAIALALPLLALAASPAGAQSGITISGMVDIGAYRGFDDVSRVGTVQRSHIAFSGSEDLGGGMAATFNLSHRLDLDTGTPEGVGSKPFWQGESTVGLKGGWGHVRLGRALDAVYGNDWAYDPWYNFDRIASPAWQFWHYNYASSRTSNNGSAEYGRLSNGVFYDSPKVNGFSVHLSGAFERDSGAGAGSGRNAGGALNYAGGGFGATLASSRNSSGDTVDFVGARYAQGAWALMGAYDRSVYKAASDSVAKAYSVGGTYAIGATTWKLSLATQDLDGVNTDFVGFGASHALSKRTSVYLSTGYKRPENGSSASAYGVGVAHSF